MATGAKMSFNYYQNGKYGTLPQNPSKDVEISQDMHLKMSKKIAQLTKVIYALNTKNDEHEAVVQALREQHEEQMQQLMAETKAKIELYRPKVGGDSEHLKKVESLEGTIQDYNKEKETILRTFEAYKNESEAKENRMMTEHSEKMLSLSHEVLQTKQDLESKLDMLMSIERAMAEDKQNALNELELKHKKNLEDLQRSQEAQKGDLSAAQQELEERYKIELEKLSKQVDQLDLENKKNTQDYEHKLNKAQAFYEKELDALKNAQNASHEEQFLKLQQSYDKLQKDLAFKEAQMQKRIDDLLSQLSLSEEERAKYRDDFNQLQDSIKNKDADSAFLIKQLEEAKQQANNAITRLKEVEAELTATTEKCEQQAKDLFKKSTEIGELEATKLQHESTIKDLTAQLEKLKDRLGWLEGAKRSLENQNQTKVEETSNQLRSLERALEDISIEKQKMKEKFERDLKQAEDTAKQNEARLKEEHKTMIDSISKTHKEESETQKKDYEEKLAELRKELSKQMEEEKEKLRKEHQLLQAAYDEMKAHLTDKLATAEAEVRRLDKLVKDSESGLGSATSQVNSLKDMADSLKSELDQTRNELRSTKSKASALQSDYDKLKILHESSMKEAAAVLKSKLDHLSRDLDTKWKETLRRECDKLRKELTAQKEEDKRAALEQLAKMKDEEMHASKYGWEKKVSELLNEISSLKTKLQSQQMMTSEEMEKVKREAEAENRKLRQEMVEAADEYVKKINILEDMYNNKLKQLEEQKDKESLARDSELRTRHLEDMQAQMTAHKATLESVRDAAEKKRLTELDSERLKHADKLEGLRSEMEQKQAMEMEQINKEHHMAMQAARMELQRAIDLTKTKEAEFAMKCSELEDTIRHHEDMIRQLEEEIRKLQSGVNDMSADLKAKGKEILRIRSEANQAAKAREEHLIREYKMEIQELQNVNQTAAEEMLAEFTQAQELLKEKISQLQAMLEEAEDRYQNRESRPEDLKFIKQLQEAVREREEVLHQLQGEKKYFQRELVNRETNFNKVFSADPKVGVLNPLQVGKKKKGQGAKIGSVGSSPTMGGRLDPLPHSPLHNASLNSMQPLPPTFKKFMK